MNPAPTTRSGLPRIALSDATTRTPHRPRTPRPRQPPTTTPRPKLTHSQQENDIWVARRAVLGASQQTGTGKHSVTEVRRNASQDPPMGFDGFGAGFRSSKALQLQAHVAPPYDQREPHATPTSRAIQPTATSSTPAATRTPPTTPTTGMRPASPIPMRGARLMPSSSTSMSQRHSSADRCSIKSSSPAEPSTKRSSTTWSMSSSAHTPSQEPARRFPIVVLSPSRC